MTAWIAWLVGPAVDLSVVGLLPGTRFLSLHGYTDVQLSKLRRMPRFCRVLTLALSTSGAIGHRMLGTALVDAVGPALLIGWSEVYSELTGRVAGLACRSRSRVLQELSRPTVADVEDRQRGEGSRLVRLRMSGFCGDRAGDKAATGLAIGIFRTLRQSTAVASSASELRKRLAVRSTGRTVDAASDLRRLLANCTDTTGTTVCHPTDSNTIRRTPRPGSETRH
jgi:hypothetical protein